MFFKSLKTKLIVTCILMGLIPLFTISMIHVIGTKVNMTDDVKTNEMLLAETNSTAVSIWLDQKIIKLESLTKDEIFINGNKDELSILLPKIAGGDSDTLELSYSDNEGNSLTSNGDDINISDKDYFNKVIKEKKTVVSDVIVSKTYNDKTIVFSTPVLNNENELTGIISMTVKTDTLDLITKQIKIGDTGYGYILSDNETYISHPKEERIGKTFKEINPEAYSIFESEIFKKDMAYVQYTASDKIEKIAASYTIPSTNWKVVVTAPTSEVYESLNAIIKNDIIIILISTVVIFLVSFLITNRIIKPINGVSEIIKRTEKLNLVDDENLLWLTKGKDEIQKMVSSIANMRKTLREMIGNINASSSVVKDSSKDLSYVLQDNTVALESVAKAVDDMAHGALELAKSTQEGAEKLAVLSTEIDIMKSTSNEMMSKVSKTENASKKGVKTIENLQTAFNKNTYVCNRIGEKVFDLSDKSKSISNITEKINEITSQINLLSLNAAIESARAGEAGKGFAIVANEIKNLALNTSVSTKEISHIIQEFTNITEEAKEEMVEAKSSLAAMDISSKETQQVFNEINLAVDEMTKEIKELVNSIESVDNNKNIVVSAIEDISAVSEESASTSEEISASIEEQSSRMEQISKSASELNDIAIKLEKLVSNFKL